MQSTISGTIAGAPEQLPAVAGYPCFRFTVLVDAPPSVVRDIAPTPYVVVLAGPGAERIAPHLRRRTHVHVDGRLDARPWVDEGGCPHAGLTLEATRLRVLHARPRLPNVGSGRPI
jgi:hypothetical protein